MKIHWGYRYINNYQSIDVNSDIDIKPDKFNRWALAGLIDISTESIKRYKWVGDRAMIVVTFIFQKGCNNGEVPSVVNKFCTEVPHFTDLDNGLGPTFIYGNTPNEVMKEFEIQFNKFFEILKTAQ